MLQPKKLIEIQIIGILEEIDPPLIWTKSKRPAAFFQAPSKMICWHQC